MDNLIKDLLSPLCYLWSFRYHKQKASPLASPSTRFKAASRHLYNSLSELLIEDRPLVSLDLGGTLIKMSVYIPDSYQQSVVISSAYVANYLPDLSFRTEYIKGTYLFFVFRTDQIISVVEFLNTNGFPFDRKKTLRCTGGGAYKYKKILLKNTGFNNIEIHDEIASLRSGMLFLMTLKIKNETQKLHQQQPEPEQHDSTPYEDICFSHDVKPKKTHDKGHKNVPRNWIYPALFVQIGSGISFVRIDAEDYTRLDGSALGGATFVGLAQLLAAAQATSQQALQSPQPYSSPQEAQNPQQSPPVEQVNSTQSYQTTRLSDAPKRGKSRSRSRPHDESAPKPGLEFKQIISQVQQGTDKPLTLSVGDIYGKSYSNMASDIPAAFFGRQDVVGTSLQDQLYALNQMLCVNIAHISVLIARQHGLKRIIFSGGFVTHEAEKQLDFGVGFYSTNQIEAIFLRHDAVVGAIGAMLGKEVEYMEAQDKIGLNIESIVTGLEEVYESDVEQPDVRFL